MSSSTAASAVFDALERQHPGAFTELDFSNAFELLVATILSAQCTDARVNQVTPALFAAYSTPAALAGLRCSELIRLTWASVNFEDGVLTIRDGKAKREDLVPLHPELLDELKRIRPANVLPSTRVFPEQVTNRTRTGDFKRAKIEVLDGQGRVAD